MVNEIPVWLDIPSLEDIEGIEEFFSQLERNLGSPHRHALELDLRRIKFMRPDSVMALICAARYWHRSTGQSTTLFAQGKPHSYLERIDAFAVCEAFLRQPSQPDEFFRRKNSSNVLEVFYIPSEEADNAATVNKSLQRAFDILLKDLDEQRLGIITTLFSEIATNIVHSRDSAYGLIQRYPNWERIDIAIADLGIGIEASLKDKYQFDWGTDYILNALQLGVTSREGVGGLGLTKVHEFVKTCRGTLTIRSHQSRVKIKEGECLTWNGLALIPGVQVFLTVWGDPD